jgi:Cu+-exporting ATPase
MIMKSATTVKDPVCGMEIETATAAGRTEHNGQTYYFCGSKCKEKFDLNPEQYVGKSAGTSKSGQGCCS